MFYMFYYIIYYYEIKSSLYYIYISMLLHYFFIINTLITVVAHCNNFKLDLLQSNIGDWMGEYTIRNSISGSIINTGSMINNNNIETHNLCLSNGAYNIIMPENNKSNQEVGLVVCENKFIGSGENVFFKITDRGCIITKTVQPVALVNNMFPIVYSYDIGSIRPTIRPTNSPTIRPTNTLSYSLNLFSYSSHSASHSSHSSHSASSASSSSHSSPNPSYKFSSSYLFSFSRSFMTNPTILPTSYPTIYPTVFPLHYPTALPTNYPTILPTTLPLRYPTVLPTNYPTVLPTNYPTVLPTNYPTIYPTVFQTVLPTIYPTVFQTVLPTTQSLPIALFNTAITLQVTSNTPFDSQTQLAICSATAITLNININDCNYQNTAFTSSLVHHLLSGYTATSSMSITVQTANPASFFASATSTLSSAASSGLFTANLVSACQSIGITNTATVIGATTSGLQIIQPPTITPTFSPTLNITHVGLTSKFTFWNIETIVSISVFGSIFIFFIMYYCYHRNLSDIIASHYQAKTVIPLSLLDSQNIDASCSYLPVNDDIVINSDDILLIDNIDSGFTDDTLLIDNTVIDNTIIDVIPQTVSLNDNDYQIIVNE